MFKKKYSLFLLLVLIGCTSNSPETSTSPPEWAYNQSIYEVNIRQFSESGTFSEFQKSLPRLKEMGIGILWLMPIHPIGEINRKGTLGSYYSVKDYFDVNPEFGTKDDFRALVNAAHDLGMYVILDWVANHTAWDNPLTSTNPDFFEKDVHGNFIPPRGTDWDDVIQLDYSNSEVWDYMISALYYWVNEFNIDGYRCDVADMVPTEFWNRARLELDAIKPVFMLAEAENPEHHYKAFDMSYSWRMHHLFNKIASGDEPPVKIDDYLKDDQKRFPTNAFRMQFTSNHDENSWNGTEFERLNDAVKAFAVLKVTMPGMPLVYNGQEAGFNRRLEFFEKDSIDWEKNEYYEFYKRLLNLKTSHPALMNGNRGGKMERIKTDDKSVYGFFRNKMDRSVLVVMNLSAEPKRLEISQRGVNGMYTDLFTDQPELITSSKVWELEPWGYYVYYQ